jgi:hypothetical protein
LVLRQFNTSQELVDPSKATAQLRGQIRLDGDEEWASEFGEYFLRYGRLGINVSFLLVDRFRRGIGVKIIKR